MTAPLYSPVDGAIIPDAWADIPEPEPRVCTCGHGNLYAPHHRATCPISAAYKHPEPVTEAQQIPNVPRWGTRYICPACEGQGKWHMTRCVVAPGQRRALLPPVQGAVVLLGPPRYPVIPPVDPEAIPQ